MDVVKVCKEFQLVNPQYLDGFTRVSCVFCPYKTLYELNLEKIDKVDDPGFIESILRRSYDRWYRGEVKFEDFINYSPIFNVLGFGNIADNVKQIIKI